MSDVVVHTRDVVGERMAGPGIRALHLATEIGRRVPTTLVAEIDPAFAAKSRLVMLPRGSREAIHAMRSAKVVFGQPTRELLRLTRRRQKFVFDLFDPVVLELPEIYAENSGLRGRAHQWVEWQRLQSALKEGDLLVCATPQQFSFYSGVFLSSGSDATGWMKRWVTVPFGVEPVDPASDGEPVDLGPDPVVVWGGGTWPWLDPGCALDAVRALRARGTAVKLLILGARRPNEAVNDAATSGWLGEATHSDAILWNREWVPYRERARWLRASRVAIMLHRRSLEAEFAIRTRLFDAIWCAVPVVVTRGGFAADLVEREGLGVVVEPSDPEDVANAIGRLLGDDEFNARCVDNLRRVRPRFEWSRVAAPLVERILEWL